MQERAYWRARRWKKKGKQWFKKKEGGVKMRRDYFLEKLADAMVHIGEILLALTLAKVLLC